MADKRKTYEGGILINGDCMKAIEKLPDDSVDLIFTSPPYFMGKDYDKSLSVDDFLDAISTIQGKMHPKLKDGGSLCWQVGSHVLNTVTTPLDILVYQVCAQFSDLKLRNRVIWTFEHGTHSKKRLSGRYETVLWYTKGDNYKFELDPIRVPQKYPGKRHYKGPNKGQLSGNPLGKNPGDVWVIPNVKANHIEKTEHPCQFPIALVSRFIRSLTLAGDVVLDPFAGSGSVAIAALEANRQFFCIELEPKYYALANERIMGWYKGCTHARADIPTAKPNPNSAVATRPDHFISEQA